MSVAFPVNADPRFRLSTATGGETVFSVPFPFQSNADIVVLRYALDGTKAELAEGKEYALTGEGNPSGGTVTLVVPMVAGERLLRVGRAILDRVSSVVRSGRFKSKAIDDDIDRFIIIAQELDRDRRRSWKVGFGHEAGTITRGIEGQLLAFDSAGDMVPVNPQNVAWRDAWQPAPVVYTKNDIVEFGGSLWRARRSNSNVVPVGGADWTLFLPGTSVGDGAVGRPKLASSISPSVHRNILEFGTNRSAFEAAHASVPAGYPIVVPAGTYDFGGEDLTTNGRRWILEGVASFPSGNLLWSTFERHNTADYGSIDAHYQAAGVDWLFRAPYRLGGQKQSVAISIGSADPRQGNLGTALFADGHSNFLGIKPEGQYNPIEINWYNYCTTGLADSIAGTNRLVRNTSLWSSMPFESHFVGKALYWRGTKYKVTQFVSADEVRVTLWNGGTVSFPGNTKGTYHFTYSMFRGRVDTNGTTVTYRSGHTFYDYFANESSVIVIDGVDFEVQSVSGEEQLTLASSAGVKSNVAYTCYAEIDGETTAIRLNHSDVGEQYTIMTSAGTEDGLGAAYLHKTNKALGDWLPIVFQNGGKDGLSVVFNNESLRAFVGIGEARRYPGCELDVNGQIRNSHIAMRGNSIEEYGANATAALALNYAGYYGTDAHFRDTDVFNGKGQLIASFDGTTRVLELQNASTVVSDATEKTVIGPALGLEFICKVDAVEYEYIDRPGRRQGILVQQLLEALEGKDFAGISKNRSGKYQFAYDELIAPLIKSVQELAARVVDLESKI